MLSRVRVALLAGLIIAPTFSLPGAVGDVWEATGWTATGYTSNTLMLQPETYYQVKISAHANVATTIRYGVSCYMTGYDHFYRLVAALVDERPVVRTFVLKTPSLADYPVLELQGAKGQFTCTDADAGVQVETFSLTELSREQAEALSPTCTYVTIPAERQPAFPKNKVPNSSFELGLAAHGTRARLPFRDTNVARPTFETDDTTAVHGRRSLKIVNPVDGCNAQVWNAECWRGEGSNCVYSVYLKADRAVTVQIRLLDIMTVWLEQTTEWKGLNNTNCVLTTDWKRFTVTGWAGMDPATMARKYMAYLVVTNAATVWMDAEQFESVPAGTRVPTDYAPAAPAEAAWVLEDNIIVRSDGAEPPVRTAELRKVVYGSGDAPDVTVENVPVDTSRYGTFQLDGTWQGYPIYPVDYAVIHELDMTPVADARDLSATGFYVGANGIIAAERPNDEPYSCWNLSKGGSTCEDNFRWLRQAGLRMLRLHDAACYWPVCEPRKGDYAWDMLDTVVGMCRKYGIEPMFVLGNGAFLAKSDAAEDPYADWFVRKNSEYVGPASMSGNVWWTPSDADWTDFTRALVNRYKGKVKYYETINEPNLSVGDAARYFHFLKLTYETVKAADPDAIVVGICSTGDYGANTAAFVRKIGELGGFSYLDVMSFHPYDSALDTTLHDAESALVQIRQIVDSYRPGCPIMDSELYYICDQTLNTSAENSSYNWPAGNLVRRYCLDAMGGCEGSVPLQARENLQKSGPESPGSAWPSRTVHRFAPNERFVAGNAFSHFLEGARFAGKPALANGLNGAVFRKPSGDPVSVVWAKESRDVAEVALPSGATAYDLYGNPLAGRVVKVETEPVYLVGAESPLPIPKYTFTPPTPVTADVTIPWNDSAVYWTDENGAHALPPTDGTADLVFDFGSCCGSNGKNVKLSLPVGTFAFHSMSLIEQGREGKDAQYQKFVYLVFVGQGVGLTTLSVGAGGFHCTPTQFENAIPNQSYGPPPKFQSLTLDLACSQEWVMDCGYFTASSSVDISDAKIVMAETDEWTWRGRSALGVAKTCDLSDFKGHLQLNGPLRHLGLAVANSFASREITWDDAAYLGNGNKWGGRNGYLLFNWGSSSEPAPSTVQDWTQDVFFCITSTVAKARYSIKLNSPETQGYSAPATNRTQFAVKGKWRGKIMADDWNAGAGVSFSTLFFGQACVPRRTRGDALVYMENDGSGLEPHLDGWSATMTAQNARPYECAITFDDTVGVIRSPNALGANNGALSVNLGYPSQNYGFGGEAGLLGAAGQRIDAKIWGCSPHGGNPNHRKGTMRLYLGAAEAGDEVVFNGKVSQYSADRTKSHQFILTAPAGGKARFNGVFGTSLWDSTSLIQPFPIMVDGVGDVVVAAQNTLLQTGMVVRSGGLVLASAWASGKTTGRDSRTILLGDRVPGVTEVKCAVTYWPSSNMKQWGIQSAAGDTITFERGLNTAPGKSLTSNEMPVDGVTLEPGDRVLLDWSYVNAGNFKNSYRDGPGRFNGVYEVVTMGTPGSTTDVAVWKRVAPLNRTADFKYGFRVKVREGLRFGGKSFMLYNDEDVYDYSRFTKDNVSFTDLSLDVETACGNYVIAFTEEAEAEPEVRLMIEGGIAVSNAVVVTDNKSARPSVLGNVTADTSEFYGNVALEKDVTFRAAAGGTVKLTGAVTGAGDIVSDGRGETDLTAADWRAETSKITISGGTLKMTSAQVAGKTVEWTIDTSVPGGGATGCLNVDGTLDLGSLTFAFAGFDDAVREPRDYEIVRATELTGMLPADPGKHWRLTKRGNAVWLSWAKAGAVLIYR